MTSGSVGSFSTSDSARRHRAFAPYWVWSPQESTALRAEYIHRRLIDTRNELTDAEFIQAKLIEHRNACTAILMISEDLDEVFGLSDRIAVMYEGKIIGIVDPATATREEVGLMMAGVTTADA